MTIPYIHVGSCEQRRKYKLRLHHDFSIHLSATQFRSYVDLGLIVVKKEKKNLTLGVLALPEHHKAYGVESDKSTISSKSYEAILFCARRAEYAHPDVARALRSLLGLLIGRGAAA